MATPRWMRLLPEFTDTEAHARAAVVLAGCGGMAMACVVLLFIWWLSGDLEFMTVIAAGILIALLVGLATLVRRGLITLSGWLLTGLLMALLTADVWSYGLGSPVAAGYLIPITLAFCALNSGAGWGCTIVSSLSVLVLAWGEVSGWHVPFAPVEISHLTFNAPALSVIFLLSATILNTRLQIAASKGPLP